MLNAAVRPMSTMDPGGQPEREQVSREIDRIGDLACVEGDAVAACFQMSVPIDVTRDPHEGWNELTTLVRQSNICRTQHMVPLCEHFSADPAVSRANLVVAGQFKAPAVRERHAQNWAAPARNDTEKRIHTPHTAGCVGAHRIDSLLNRTRVTLGT